MEFAKVLKQLEWYGLGETEARVFIWMVRAKREVSIVEMARGLKMGRTPVYNALDRLTERGLVSKLAGESGFRFIADARLLSRYWGKRMEQAQKLEDRLPTLVETLEGMTVGAGYQTKAEYFTGKRGLEQIIYNSLRAKGDLYVYEMGEAREKLIERQAMKRCLEKLVEKEAKVHLLTNQEEFSVKGKFWDVRRVDPEVMAIRFETVIYNDVVAMYGVEGRELFGVEIHNANLAEMQKQIFKAVAMGAKALTKKGRRGEAHLK